MKFIISTSAMNRFDILMELVKNLIFFNQKVLSASFSNSEEDVISLFEFGSEGNTQNLFKFNFEGNTQSLSDSEVNDFNIESNTRDFIKSSSSYFYNLLKINFEAYRIKNSTLFHQNYPNNEIKILGPIEKYVLENKNFNIDKNGDIDFNNSINNINSKDLEKILVYLYDNLLHCFEICGFKPDGIVKENIDKLFFSLCLAKRSNDDKTKYNFMIEGFKSILNLLLTNQLYFRIKYTGQNFSKQEINKIRTNCWNIQNTLEILIRILQLTYSFSNMDKPDFIYILDIEFYNSLLGTNNNFEVYKKMFSDLDNFNLYKSFWRKIDSDNMNCHLFLVEISDQNMKMCDVENFLIDKKKDFDEKNQSYLKNRGFRKFPRCLFMKELSVYFCIAANQIDNSDFYKKLFVKYHESFPITDFLKQLKTS